MNYKTAVIDLDNCIADDGWRMHLCRLDQVAPNDRYWDYHEACEGDMYHNHDIVNDILRRGYQLVIFTARPEAVRWKTQRWLRKWNIPYTRLFMRPNDNHEGSVVLKRRMLTEWLDRELCDVEIAMDDRDDVLDMYREEGIRIILKTEINQPKVIHP